VTAPRVSGYDRRVETGQRSSQAASDLVHERAHDAYVVTLNLLLRVPFHRFREWVFRALAFNHLGRGATVERAVRLTARGGVKVGAGTIVNRDTTLDGRGMLTIGISVNISPEAVILTADHEPQSPDFAYRVRPTTIGDRAWISYRAIVLPGAVVGEGAIVAAGAIVHGEVAPWTIVAGNPARVVGHRSSEAQFKIGAPYRRLFH
jgi:acetyltransferase-like isoleucine patch superfamily enzyme